MVYLWSENWDDERFRIPEPQFSLLWSAMDFEPLWKGQIQPHSILNSLHKLSPKILCGESIKEYGFNLSYSTLEQFIRDLTRIANQSEKEETFVKWEARN